MKVNNPLEKKVIDLDICSLYPEILAIRQINEDLMKKMRDTMGIPKHVIDDSK